MALLVVLLTKDFTSLKSLNLQNCGIEGVVDLMEFNTLENLNELELGYNKIESLGSSFQDKGQLKLNKLEVLGLSGNQFTNSIFSSLRALPNLKSLYLDFNKLRGPINVKDLNVLTNLEELMLWSNGITEVVPSQELRLMNLSILNLIDNPLDNSKLSSLGRLSTLKILSFGSTKLKISINITDIDGLRNLEEMHVDCSSDTDCSFSLQSLELFPSLKALYLFGFSFDETDSYSQNSFCGLTNLRELNMEGNNLKDYVRYVTTVARAPADPYSLDEPWTMMEKKKNPLIFMDVSIDGDPFERMIFELFPDVAPKTAENFRALCTGEKGIGPKTGKPLHYKGSFLHRVIKGSLAQGGDFVRRDGTSGESIYDGKFPDEQPRLKHDGPGLLSMAIADRDTVGSQFVITFKANHNLDRKYVVFGKLVQGNEVLKKIENVGDEEGIPTVTVKIVNCGEVGEGKEKRKNKLKMGKDASDAGNYEVRRKGKHKKSSRDRRKRRRRYYSSDSESSSDSETESSDSDSDSDSYLSSSSESDISSSSDDRHKKRKRSYKREKYRHGKRRDRRRDKKRRKHDKRSKRRSKRAADSLSDDGSESKTESSTDDDVDTQGKVQKDKNLSKKSVGSRSHSAVEKEILHGKREEAELRVKEHEAPKENGERQSNGIEKDAKSDRSAERQPDVVDDHPSKSRSRSMSPKRTISKSMSVSPRRPSCSPSPSPRQSASRSPPRSPGRIRSGTAVGGLSESPLRGRKSRSISRSPVRGRSQRSISRSPVRSRSRKSPSRSPPRSSAGAHSRRSISRSPVRSLRRSISRSPVRSSHRSKSRSSGRAPPRRSPSGSPLRETTRKYRRNYSRSPTPVRRVRSPPADRGRGLSRSASPDASPKRIRRGRGFSERYSYARRYRTPSPDRSPVKSYRYSGRNDNERYSSYRRYSPRRYRSPQRGVPPRFRGRRSRTRSLSVSPSPRYRNRRYSHSPSRSRSPIRSRSPVDPTRSRASPRAGRRRSPSQSRSRSESSSSLDSQSPKQASKVRSRSSSGSPDGKKGLVSYDDGSPDSGR
ncbi:hypothetical protein V6N13_076364 [Hibiscus sabdariffa]